MANMKTSLNKRFGALIAARDLGGWMCAYCYRTLDPTHAGPVELTYNTYEPGGPPAFYQAWDGQYYPNTPDWRTVLYDDAPCVDHVVPRSEGGPSTLDNFVLCCRSCNSRKGNR